ncbi:GNAT family N-acetyltransferase [Pseudomonas sp. NPDC090202]|uniref:GNAT family N-acetyltransferase n=1 Tax=unclassified Pseudomonas TaxID=196821 RepID=UPI0038018CF3
MHYQPLPDLQRPLLDKFYRAHRAGMRARGEAQIWVAKDREIVAALNLTPVAGGHWLTGLFVAPERRGRGIAARLVQVATEDVEGCVWLFCDAALADFYARMGFAETTVMPQALADRLARYRQTKALIAMVR